MTEFYPPNGVVPEEIRTEHLLLRPLTVAHVELDYAAVMASREQLNRWSDTTWPTPDFTLAENRADLARHQQEHREGVAFTYTVLTPDEARCLGCVYITPIPDTAAHLYTKERYSGQSHLLDTQRRNGQGTGKSPARHPARLVCSRVALRSGDLHHQSAKQQASGPPGKARACAAGSRLPGGWASLLALCRIKICTSALCGVSYTTVFPVIFPQTRSVL